MTVHIVRGPSGCGKSTFAEKLKEDLISEMRSECTWADIKAPAIHAADDWFTTKDGEYKFDPRFLSRAHTETITRVMESVFLGRQVVVANTFINYWEISPYLWMAKLAGVRCIVYEPDIARFPEDKTVHNRLNRIATMLFERCTHGVPLETIENHITNFHLLEVGGLVSEVKQYETGLL